MDVARKAYWIFALYTLGFALLRLLQADNFNHDEAEQYLNAQNFELFYPKQPPLYSWILFGLARFLPLDLGLVTFFKYALYFLFLVIFYRLMIDFSNQRSAFLATSSLAFFLTYSYDFNRDLTHSLLVTVFAVASFYCFLSLAKNPSWTKYLCLGFLFAGGILAKYNFAFLVFILLIVALIKKRDLLFNFKALISALFCFGLLLPHFYSLYQHQFKIFSYTIARADREQGFSLLNSSVALLQAYYEHLIVVLILFLLWRPVMTRIKENSLIELSFLLSLVLPALFILIGGFEHFHPKWFAPLSFLVPLWFFDTYALAPEFKLRQKIHYLLVSAFLLFFLVVDLGGFCFPDLVGDAQSKSYPYAKISAQLKKDLGYPADIVTLARPRLQANLSKQMPEHKIYSLKQLARFEPGCKILVWKNSNQELKIPKLFYKKFKRIIPKKVITANTINSRKHFYHLAYAYACNISDPNQNFQ